MILRVELGVLEQRERDVLRDGERAEERARLVDDPHLAVELLHLAHVRRRDVHAEDADAARLRLLQADQVLEQRRLAAARAAEDHHDLAAADGHADVVEDDLVAVAGGQVLDLDHDLLRRLRVGGARRGVDGLGGVGGGRGVRLGDIAPQPTGRRSARATAVRRRPPRRRRSPARSSAGRGAPHRRRRTARRRSRRGGCPRAVRLGVLELDDRRQEAGDGEVGEQHVEPALEHLRGRRAADGDAPSGPRVEGADGADRVGERQRRGGEEVRPVRALHVEADDGVGGEEAVEGAFDGVHGSALEPALLRGGAPPSERRHRGDRGVAPHSIAFCTLHRRPGLASGRRVGRGEHEVRSRCPRYLARPGGRPCRS